MTLTIGLDDLHFDTIVRACLTPSSITPTGLARWAHACQSRQTSIRRRLTLVGTNLRRILQQILALRPAPQVFVTGYYDPWPAPTDIGRCSETHRDLSSIAFALATENGNVAALIRWERRFDALLQRTAHSAGAKFVPLEQAFVGHKLCSQSEWVIFPSRANQKNFSALHPTRAGQQRLAALIRAAASNGASPS